MTRWIDQGGSPVEPAPSGSWIWVSAEGSEHWRNFSDRLLRFVHVEDPDGFPGIDRDVFESIFVERPSGELAIEVDE